LPALLRRGLGLAGFGLFWLALKGLAALVNWAWYWVGNLGLVCRGAIGLLWFGAFITDDYEFLRCRRRSEEKLEAGAEPPALREGP